MAVDWAVEAVRDAIVRLQDVGTAPGRAELREEVGIGSGDLDAALAALKTAGEVRESEDGVLFTVGVAPAPLSVVQDPVQDAPAASVPASVAEAVMPAVNASWGYPAAREVVLMRAMVEGMEDATLGALVAAGVAAADGVEFVLRVQ